MKPRARIQLLTAGRSGTPATRKSPVPGTGRRPLQPFRDGVSADARHEMFPSTSPQIRFSDGEFQYGAASRNDAAVAQPATVSGRPGKAPCRVRAALNAARRRDAARSSTWKIGPWRVNFISNGVAAAPLTGISSRTIRIDSHPPFHFTSFVDLPDSVPRRRRPAGRCRRWSVPSAIRSLCPIATPRKGGSDAPATFHPGALRWTM